MLTTPKNVPGLSRAFLAAVRWTLAAPRAIRGWSETMRVEIRVGAYNSRRYGKPWIARVTDWPVGKHPVLEFGATVDLQVCEIEAEPGSIVRWGQKDYRGNNTTREWGIVCADGSVNNSDAVRCRGHWLAGCPVPAEAED